MIMPIDAGLSASSNGYTNGHSAQKTTPAYSTPSGSGKTLLETFLTGQETVQAHR